MLSPYINIVACLVILFFAGCEKFKSDNPLVLLNDFE